MSCRRRGAVEGAPSASHRLCNRPFEAPMLWISEINSSFRISEKLPEQSANPSSDAHQRAGTDRGTIAADRVAIAIEHEPDARRERRTVDVVRQSADARRTSAADRQIQN